MARKANDLFDIFNQQSELAAAEARKRARRDERRASRKNTPAKSARKTQSTGSKVAKRASGSSSSSKSSATTHANSDRGFRNRLFGPEGLFSPNSGTFVSGRQILLATAAGALAIFLAFFLGLSSGGSKKSTNATLQRDTQQAVTILTWVQRAKNTGQLLTSKELGYTLVRRYKIGRHMIHRIEVAGTKLLVELGPFPSLELAKGYIRRKALDTVDIYGRAPFRFAEFPSWDR